jgi:hypothetical protein
VQRSTVATLSIPQRHHVHVNEFCHDRRYGSHRHVIARVKLDLRRPSAPRFALQRGIFVHHAEYIFVSAALGGFSATNMPAKS